MSGCPDSAARSPARSRSTEHDGRDMAATGFQAMESEVTSIVSRIRIVLPVVALGLTLSACGYNTIPTLEEQAKARWADVQNQYQRRADLIPNLVSAVQGYAKQEKDTLTAVTEGRAKGTSINIDA